MYLGLQIIAGYSILVTDYKIGQSLGWPTGIFALWLKGFIALITESVWDPPYRAF